VDSGFYSLQFLVDAVNGCAGLCYKTLALHLGGFGRFAERSLRSFLGFEQAILISLLLTGHAFVPALMNLLRGVVGNGRLDIKMHRSSIQRQAGGQAGLGTTRGCNPERVPNRKPSN
jgi:hypothetical protein